MSRNPAPGTDFPKGVAGEFGGGYQVDGGEDEDAGDDGPAAFEGIEHGVQNLDECSEKQQGVEHSSGS